MHEMTFNEEQKIYEIVGRLRGLLSPVLRLQAILQFSQIVDMLALGDTNNEEHRNTIKLIEENERLTKELNSLKDENGEAPIT